MHKCEQLSLNDVAGLLNISKSAAQSYLKRAVNKINSEMQCNLFYKFCYTNDTLLR